MSNVVDNPLIFKCFSQFSHSFINIHDYTDKIICILDNFVNMLCLSIYLKPSLVLLGT